MYQTEVTAYVQEPKIAAVAPPTLYADYEKEYEKEQALIRKKMAKDTVLIRTFAEEQVSVSQVCVGLWVLGYDILQDL